MILIIGPAFSGKREYARSILEGKRILPGSISRIRPEEEAASETISAADADWEELILTEVQEMVREEMEEQELLALADSLCRRARILTASETGAGIVPAESRLRRRREKQGRLLSMLAQRADSVIRVFYGIPEVLKGAHTL